MTSLPVRPPSSDKDLVEFYQTSTAYRDNLASKQAASFTRFIELVRRHAPGGARVLEVGCGTGQASRLLREAGFRVTGCDLSALFLREAARGEAPVSSVAADLVRLPFGDETFDVVAGRELVEHLADVGAALDEMARVIRPGGLIVLRSPALASPVWPLLDASNLLRGRGGRPPHYTNLREAFAFIVRNKLRTFRILARRRPAFERREPLLTGEHIGGDADAAYWSSPIEIARHLRRRGFRVLQQVDSGRCCSARWWVAKCMPWLSPTIALAARKR